MIPSIWMPRRPTWGRIGLGGSGGALPAPSSLTHGAYYTFTGLGFGTKATAAPLAWEPFTDATLHAALNLMGGTMGNQDNLRTALAGYNARCDFGYATADQPYGWQYTGAVYAPKWFVSYWIKLAANWHWGTNYTDDVGCTNIKWQRFYPSGELYSNTGLSSLLPTAGNNGYRFTEKSSGSAETPVYFMRMQDVFTLDTYHHVQVEYGSASGLDTADGHLRVWIGGSLKHTSDIVITDGSPASYLPNKRPGGHFGFQESSMALTSLGDAHRYAYYDQLYVDSSWARVELGDSATYGDCTRREIQPCTAWGDTSITITVNKGGFSPGATVYPHVTHADGTRQVLSALTIN